MRELEDVALAFDRACRKAGVAYALLDGIAVVAWGQPRMTMDVDALVRLTAATAGRLATATGQEGLRASEEDLREALRDGSHATVFDVQSSLHVNIKIARSLEEISEVEDAVEVPFGTGSLRIVRAEDTIAYKLKFGSDQDLTDARSILARRAGKLDMARLDRLCLKLGVAKTLKHVRDPVARATK